MRLVLDASLTLSWFFKEQRVERSVKALRQVRQSGALVPNLWNVEVAHVLLRYERRGDLTQDRTASICDYLRALPISVDPASEDPTFATLTFARAHDLSAYDASYLDLAVRFNLKLATLDRRLEAAARALAVSWDSTAPRRRS